MASPDRDRISQFSLSFEISCLHAWTVSVILLILSVCFLAQTGAAQIIGNHPAVYDQRGILQPWTPVARCAGTRSELVFEMPVDERLPAFRGDDLHGWPL